MVSSPLNFRKYETWAWVLGKDSWCKALFSYLLRSQRQAEVRAEQGWHWPDGWVGTGGR